MSTRDLPVFMTIRQVAATGILSEHALRQMAKQGLLPCIYAGNKCLINFDLLIDKLNHLSEDQGKAGSK